MSNKIEYSRLHGDSPAFSEDGEANDTITDIDHITTYRRNRFGKHLHRLNIFSQFLSWSLVLTLLYANILPRTWGSNRFKQNKLLPSQLTYSPAQDAIDYKVKVFPHGFESMPGGVAPEFSGPPSDRLDSAWSDLYNFGMSTISKQQAALLPNKTSPIPDQLDKYIVQLDVFHQLHCLNRLRKALNPHYFCPKDDPHCDDHRAMAIGYDPDAEVVGHLMHCLHSLRESLMCHSDITPVVWHKSERPRKSTGKYFNMGYLTTAHTCRNFEKIKEWALERQVHGEIDFDIVPEEDGIRVPVYQAP